MERKATTSTNNNYKNINRSSKTVDSNNSDTASSASITLDIMKSRVLSTAEIVMGCVWIGPGGGPNGDGDRLDLGQTNANETIKTALNMGIIEFDTAPFYGSGASEERLGRALLQYQKSETSKQEETQHGEGDSSKTNTAGETRQGSTSKPATKPRAITKTGRLIWESDRITPAGPVGGDTFPPFFHHQRVLTNDYTANGADTSLRHSLKRLGMDKVWGLRIHDPNDNNINRGELVVDEVGIALDKNNGMCQRLVELRDKEGIISHVSLGMNSNVESHFGVPHEILRLIQGCPLGTFDSALLAGGWNLLNQDGYPCLLECQKQNIDVHVAGVFGSGLLAAISTEKGKQPQLLRYAYEAASSDIVERAVKWRNLAEEFHCQLQEVAIAFSVFPRVVTRVVIGMETPQQVTQNVEWAKQSSQIPSELWTQAKDLGLLPNYIPTP